MALPSLAGKQDYAADDSPYVLTNPNNVPMEKLFADNFPLPEKWRDVSIPVPGTAKPGYSPVFRNKAFPNGLKEGVLPEIATYHDIFELAVKSYTNEPAIAKRAYDPVTKVNGDYHAKTYAEINKEKNDLGSGVLFLLKNNPYLDAQRFASHQKILDHEKIYRLFNQDNMSFVLTLYAPNCEEWVVTDLMCLSFSITNTALYDTLGPETSEYILLTTESPVVIALKQHIPHLIKFKQTNPELGNLISIISIEPLGEYDQPLVQSAHAQNITLFDFQQVQKFGEIAGNQPCPPSPDTLYTISFTSGTTGANPKGVLLTQRIAMSGIVFGLCHLPVQTRMKSFCFLPLAHIFERQTTACTLSRGCCIGMPQYGGSPLTLVEDLKLWKPNYMANVPRVYTKFEAALKSATIDNPSAFKQKVFGHVIESKENAQAQHDGATGSNFLYDHLFISKLRAALGFDNMSFVITGSAPISPSTMKFLKAALACGFAQGYGLTESFAGFALSPQWQAVPGSLGPTSVTVEMRVRELPEMGHFLQNDDGLLRGELQLRGPQIFNTYYKNPEETAKAVDEEGWFSTGDVAKIDKDGRLHIIDRVKNFFKLAQGEYVTPEKVENIYLSNNSILTQAYAHGDSLRNFLIGVIGVTKEGITDFLLAQGANPGDLKSDADILLVANKPEHRKSLLAQLNKNVDGKLQGFEKFHNLEIQFEPLTLERGLITPTVKLKRPACKAFFKEVLDQRYDEGSLIRGNKL